MAKKKLLAVKFDQVNKARILGKVGHTRTGACPNKGKCHHGRPRRGK